MSEKILIYNKSAKVKLVQQEYDSCTAASHKMFAKISQNSINVNE